MKLKYDNDKKTAKQRDGFNCGFGHNRESSGNLLVGFQFPAALMAKLIIRIQFNYLQFHLNYWLKNF